LRPRPVTLSFVDDAKTPIQFFLFDRPDCCDGVLDLVLVLPCRSNFQALAAIQATSVFGAVRDTHADIIKFFFGAMEAAKPLARKTHAAAIAFYRMSFDLTVVWICQVT